MPESSPRRRGRPLKILPAHQKAKNPPAAPGKTPITKLQPLGSSPRQYMSPNEVGAELGVTGESVKQWIYRRMLPAVKKSNGYWRIKREELAAFLHERQNHTHPRVMIVDDDRTLIRQAETILTDAGCQVQISLNPTDVLLKAQDRRPDLILLNLDFDQGAGRALATRLRGLRHLQNTPILFLGEKAPSSEHMGFLLKIGGKAFLTKPVATKNLLREIKHALCIDNLPTKYKSPHEKNFPI